MNVEQLHAPGQSVLLSNGRSVRLLGLGLGPRLDEAGLRCEVSQASGGPREHEVRMLSLRDGTFLVGAWRQWVAIAGGNGVCFVGEGDERKELAYPEDHGLGECVELLPVSERLVVATTFDVFAVDGELHVAWRAKLPNGLVRAARGGEMGEILLRMERLGTPPIFRNDLLSVQVDGETGVVRSVVVTE